MRKRQEPKEPARPIGFYWIAIVHPAPETEANARSDQYTPRVMYWDGDAWCHFGETCRYEAERIPDDEVLLLSECLTPPTYRWVFTAPKIVRE